MARFTRQRDSAGGRKKYNPRHRPLDGAAHSIHKGGHDHKSLLSSAVKESRRSVHFFNEGDSYYVRRLIAVCRLSYAEWSTSFFSAMLIACLSESRSLDPLEHASRPSALVGFIDGWLDIGTNRPPAVDIEEGGWRAPLVLIIGIRWRRIKIQA